MSVYGDYEIDLIDKERLEENYFDCFDEEYKKLKNPNINIKNNKTKKHGCFTRPKVKYDFESLGIVLIIIVGFLLFLKLIQI